MYYVLRSSISSSWEYDVFLESPDYLRVPEKRGRLISVITRLLDKGMKECLKPYVEIKFNREFRIECSSSSREFFLPTIEEDARLFFDALDHTLARG